MNDPSAVLTYLAEVDVADKARSQLRRQAVRDARKGGATITEIAAALGTTNRAGLYDILGEAPPPPAAVLPTPVIFLRGAGVNSPTWAGVLNAVHTRGWVAVRDRAQAWHLARGHVPVVLVDITHKQPTVGRVKARYDAQQQPELPYARAATHLAALDIDQLALAIIDHLTAEHAGSDNEDTDPGGWATATPPTGVTSKRRMSLPKQLWDQAQHSVDAGRAQSTQQLIADALDILMAKLERKHGGPFPPVDRLTAGRRTLPARGQALRECKITLDQAAWARARAVVASGGAASLPALFVRALQEHLSAA
jgi:hypothetical protein